MLGNKISHQVINVTVLVPLCFGIHMEHDKFTQSQVFQALEGAAKLISCIDSRDPSVGSFWFESVFVSIYMESNAGWKQQILFANSRCIVRGSGSSAAGRLSYKSLNSFLVCYISRVNWPLKAWDGAHLHQPGCMLRDAIQDSSGACCYGNYILYQHPGDLTINSEMILDCKFHSVSFCLEV